MRSDIQPLRTSNTQTIFRTDRLSVVSSVYKARYNAVFWKRWNICQKPSRYVIFLTLYYWRSSDKFAWTVIKTFEKELLADGINSLKPLERADVLDGVAHPDEVKQVVVNRSGSILSASTILKSDFFSNLQKMTLPECVITNSSVLLHLSGTYSTTSTQADWWLSQLPAGSFDVTTHIFSTNHDWKWCWQRKNGMRKVRGLFSFLQYHK